MLFLHSYGITWQVTKKNSDSVDKLLEYERRGGVMNHNMTDVNKTGEFYIEDRVYWNEYAENLIPQGLLQ